MSRTIKNKLTGFTPSFDVIDDELGPEASKIFGAVWRYCQMENGVCFASIEKIAARAKYERKLVMKKIKILVEKGYLIDLTPGVRNKPHVYADSGKIEMVSETKAGFTPVIEENDNKEVSPASTPTLEEVSLSGTPPNNRYPSQGQQVSSTGIPRCTSEGLEDSIKDRNKETKKIKNSQQDLFENPLTKEDIKIASIIFDASKTQILGEISDGMFNTWVRPLWFVNFDSATRQVVIGVFSDMALQALKKEKIDVLFAKIFKRLWTADVSLVFIVKTPDNK